jgi:hypothetical protein
LFCQDTFDRFGNIFPTVWVGSISFFPGAGSFSHPYPDRVSGANPKTPLQYAIFLKKCQAPKQLFLKKITEILKILLFFLPGIGEPISNGPPR